MANQVWDKVEQHVRNDACYDAVRDANGCDEYLCLLAKGRIDSLVSKWNQDQC